MEYAIRRQGRLASGRDCPIRRMASIFGSGNRTPMYGALMVGAALELGCRGSAGSAAPASTLNSEDSSMQSPSATSAPGVAFRAATPEQQGEMPQTPEEVTFPPHWCERAVPDSYDVLAEVATVYYEAQKSACATSKLTQDMGDETSLEWNNYLIDYANVLAGCAVPPASLGGRGFLPGGIGEFGLANLAAVGLEQPRLGSDDAELLIGEFVPVFAEALHLSEVERAAVRIFLEKAAQSQIDSGISGTLSVCGKGTPSSL
jgi:hypothetical protein